MGVTPMSDLTDEELDQRIRQVEIELLLLMLACPRPDSNQHLCCLEGSCPIRWATRA